MQLLRTLTASSCRRDDGAAELPNRRLRRPEGGSRFDRRYLGNVRRATVNRAERTCVACARASWGRT